MQVQVGDVWGLGKPDSCVHCFSFLRAGGTWVAKCFPRGWRVWGEQSCLRVVISTEVIRTVGEGKTWSSRRSRCLSLSPGTRQCQHSHGLLSKTAFSCLLKVGL